MLSAKQYAIANAGRRARLAEATGRGGSVGRVVGWMTGVVVVALDNDSGWRLKTNDSKVTLVGGHGVAEDETVWAVTVKNLEIVEDQ